MKRILIIICICAALAIPITLFRNALVNKANQEHLKRVQAESQVIKAQGTIKANLNQIDQLKKQNEDLQKQLQSKAEQKQTIALASQRASAGTIATVITGDKSVWLTQAGIPENLWGYVDYIVSHEGGWNGTTKYNYGGSGAYGLCQALPGSKMASAGADWETNPVTQLKWCNSYANRYGGWAGAYNAWLNQHWW